MSTKWLFLIACGMASASIFITPDSALIEVYCRFMGGVSVGIAIILYNQKTF